MANILGGHAPEEFLAQYWQQRPLLIRDALPGYRAPLSTDELAGLALEPEVESRLISVNAQANGAEPEWTLRHGPFAEADFLTLPAVDWTLLVQAVDLWVPQIRSLLARFDFIPSWRLDDVMASCAAPGGSVGPHFDQYDVFLLQVEGTRRWQLGSFCDANTPLLANTPLQLVAGFEPTQDWLLHPGDMLYLPPGLSHWGMAESQCMTFSIGFRSPSLADMLSDLAIELQAQGNAPQYRDPPLTRAMGSEHIDTAFIDQATHMLKGVLNDRHLIEDWFARYMTAPKYPELEQQTGERRVAKIAGRTYCNGRLQG